MKYTERLLGLTILSIVFIVVGVSGFILAHMYGDGIVFPAFFFVAGVVSLIWAVIRRIRYSSHPELREKDECPAKDERSMLINLKATNVVYFTLFMAVIIANFYGTYLAEFLDSTLGDTVSIIRAVCLALIVLIGVSYVCAYLFFQKVN